MLSSSISTVALANLLALVEVNRSDAVGDLRRDVHGFVGAQRAERLDLVSELLLGRMRGDDSDGAGAALAVRPAGVRRRR